MGYVVVLLLSLSSFLWCFRIDSVASVVSESEQEQGTPQNEEYENPCANCHGCLYRGGCRHVTKFPNASPERCHENGGDWCTEDGELLPEYYEEKEKELEIVHSDTDMPPYEPADGGELLDETTCASLADAWAAGQRKLAQDRRDSEFTNATIFLHVPRTAGRIIHHCVLSPTLGDRCPRSYDTLRVNYSDPTSAACGYFTSHHDHRLVDLATVHGRPHVVLMVRSPFDRVISSYEFAAEVSARIRERDKLCKPAKTCTRHVWPWNHLVRFFDHTFLDEGRIRRHHARVAAANASINRSNETSAVALDSEQLNMTADPAADAAADKLDEARDPYNNSVLVPLVEFLNMEMAEDILNNALTFQLLGLTELTPVISPEDGSGPVAVALAAKNGDLSEMDLPLSASPRLAAQLRRCTRNYGPEAHVSKILLEIALDRLQDVDLLMVHERLDESIAVARLLNKERRPGVEEWNDSNLSKCVEKRTSKMLTRKDLGSSNMRWPDGTSIEHGKTSRAKISDDIVADVQGRNWMDFTLYEHALNIFDARLRDLQARGDFASTQGESVVKDMDLRSDRRKANEL